MRVDIGLVGYSGTVGREFLRLLKERKSLLKDKYQIEFNLTAAINSRGAVWSEQELDPAVLLKADSVPGFRTGVNGLDVIKDCSARVIVEAGPTNIQTGEPGLSYFKAALDSGKHLVALDKGPLVVAYQELTELARQNNLFIKTSGATAAALPAGDLGLYSLAGCEISRIYGVLNGTTNIILTAMMDGEVSYDEALKHAQRQGIAEADPRLDVEGYDTAVKILLLANLIMDAQLSLDDMTVEGITSLSTEEIDKARAEGRVYKLIGEARRDGEGITASVFLKDLPGDHPLARVEKTEKALIYETDLMGELMVAGGRSNPRGAAAAALKDLINIGRSL